MGVEGLVYFGIVLLLERAFMWQPRLRMRHYLRVATGRRQQGGYGGAEEAQAGGQPPEEDVAKEAARVEGSNGTACNGQDSLVIRRLTKVYKSWGKPDNTAVNNLSFGVHEAECFGLLGVNGAAPLPSPPPPLLSPAPSETHNTTNTQQPAIRPLCTHTCPLILASQYFYTEYHVNIHT